MKYLQLKCTIHFVEGLAKYLPSQHNLELVAYKNINHITKAIDQNHCFRPGSCRYCYYRTLISISYFQDKFNIESGNKADTIVAKL